MEKLFMVEFELPRVMDEAFLRLIPEQRNFINFLLADGKIKSYSLSSDRSTLWAVMMAKSEIEVLELIGQMPLQAYMTPNISELMFHNTQERVLQFSLN